MGTITHCRDGSSQSTRGNFQWFQGRSTSLRRCQSCGIAFLPTFFGPESSSLFSFRFLGPRPFVLPVGFDTFFGRELGAPWFAFGASVPALIVLIAAYLTPALIGYRLVAAADTETSRFFPCRAFCAWRRWDSFRSAVWLLPRSYSARLVLWKSRQVSQ